MRQPKLLFVVLVAAAACASTAAGTVFNVRDFGAVGDGITKDTLAIQWTFGNCSLAGGGTVLFPSAATTTNPTVYYTGGFNLTSFTTVQIDRGVIILASPDPDDYALVTPLPSYPITKDNTNPRFAGVIAGFDLQNVTITGEGTVDGNGPKWWSQKSLVPTKPALFHVRNCRDVLIGGGSGSSLTFQNSPRYTVHPWDSQRITIDTVSILNPPGAPHTDGIDPDSCEDVVIRNCTISTSDDHISLKSGKGTPGNSYGKPTNNVQIIHNLFGAGSGIAIGSETAGSITNVAVSDATYYGSTANLVRIKSCSWYGGVIENITYHQIVAGAAVGIAVYVDMFYECDASQPGPVPVLSNIDLIDIGTRSGAIIGESGVFKCANDPSAGNNGCQINMNGVSVPSVLGWTNCTNVYGTIDDVTPKPCYT